MSTPTAGGRQPLVIASQQLPGARRTKRSLGADWRRAPVAAARGGGHIHFSIFPRFSLSLSLSLHFSLSGRSDTPQHFGVERHRSGSIVVEESVGGTPLSCCACKPRLRRRISDALTTLMLWRTERLDGHYDDWQRNCPVAAQTVRSLQRIFDKINRPRHGCNIRYRIENKKNVM